MLKVTGGEEVRALSLRLKAAGEVGLRLRMRAAMRATTANAARAAQAAEIATLPHGGGLGEWVAAAKPSTQILTGPRSAGVRLVQRKTGHDLASLNRGRLRHPVYGNRKNWVDQQVPSGWWDRALEAYGPAVLAGCQLAMDETARLAGFTYT